MQQSCGNCNFHINSKADQQGVSFLCLLDNRQHSEGHSCNHWNEYLHNISADARVKMASDIRNNIEAQKRHNETLQHNTQIAVLSFLLGIISTLLVQKILSLWK
jgi:hypothetical protein